MINISQFLLDVAEIQFTKACDKHKINRRMLKEMCDTISDSERHKITPFSTKQQIVYHYISYVIQQQQNS